MANYLLDTPVIIDYLRGKGATVELLRKLVSEGSLLGCCLISIIEVYAGMQESEREATGEFLDSLEYYEVTKETAKEAGEYKRAYQKRGISLSLPDAAIAAVAIANDLTLLTDTPRHYPMSAIKLHPVQGNEENKRTLETV